MSDDRIVMTLDAGGTNFVFSAISNDTEIVKPITLPSNGHDLELCLNTIISGFGQVKSSLSSNPSAISFAFPGPADYPRGIIGDLGNLPAFRGGVALGPCLSEKFNLPVFINNDGDLFTYGESVAGLLPFANQMLADAGSSKRYSNLFGITLGTGFGGGIVRNGELFGGDNSAAGEIWIMRHRNGTTFAEEGACIRAVLREYQKLSNVPPPAEITPKDIYNIAMGNADGDRTAAKEAFRMLGESVGDSLANAITLIDGLVAVGGGLAGASELFMPAIIDEMNSTIKSMSDNYINRMESKAFNLEDADSLKEFLKITEVEINIPLSDKKIKYDPMKRVAVGLSRLGTSKAISIGAYRFALNEIDRGTK